MLPSKTIKDPKATKPEDWDERAKIEDPEDVKPAGWDDIPATIPDPDATKPDDWNDEEDGTWEAPTKPNPEFKGEFKAKQIDNPAYKGIWVAPDIDNPEYKPDPLLYNYKDLKYVGFELWQVKSGSIFDNIIVTDDLKAAETFAEETWGKSKEAEKAMMDKIKEAEKAEAAAKAPAETPAGEASGDAAPADDVDDYDYPSDGKEEL
jgi:calreticulin